MTVTVARRALKKLAFVGRRLNGKRAVFAERKAPVRRIERRFVRAVRQRPLNAFRRARNRTVCGKRRKVVSFVLRRRKRGNRKIVTLYGKVVYLRKRRYRHFRFALVAALGNDGFYGIYAAVIERKRIARKFRFRAVKRHDELILSRAAHKRRDKVRFIQRRARIKRGFSAVVYGKLYGLGGRNPDFDRADIPIAAQSSDNRSRYTFRAPTAYNRPLNPRFLPTATLPCTRRSCRLFRP